MDANPEMLQTLSQWFLQTLSPSPEPRRAAESSLSSAAEQPGFSLAVLRLVSEPAVDEQIRLSAAVHFKNHLRSRWLPTDSTSIPDSEKNQIKSHIVALMLAASPKIKSQLGEALSIISTHDFPQRWQALLPQLVTSLRSSTDYASINGLLDAAASIFARFRNAFDTPALRLDLKYCLDGFAAPLLEIFLKTASLIAANVNGAPEILRPLLASQRLCCEIFYSLNCVELPEFFEDHMKEWMTEFRVYLTTIYPGPVESDGTTDALRAAVCENLQLYMEKNEEEFQPYLSDFASAVWVLLMSSATSPSRDQLTITAIKFLTTVSTSVHHALFGNQESLQQICQGIVFPNVRLRDEDEELFEMNYIEYIRRDIEGSDVDTRRRIACELLKGISSNYKEQVKTLVSMHIQNMLTLYRANPVENWKDADCAIYLVVSLAMRGSGTSVATHLVDVENFFTSVIVPELQSKDVNSNPVLKAGALKFFVVFRDQIPKPAVMTLLPDVIRYLNTESNVVHSYAANCIEKLLLVKDKTTIPAAGSTAILSQRRYSGEDIGPFLPSLMTNLFKALELPESQENPYVMKCIMRVIGIANVGGDVATACIARLASVLGEVCKNPKDPIFNHYLFEAIAALLKQSCEKDPALINVFEANLFPVLQVILANDVTEFWPYAFQIFAQLVETSKPPLSATYMQLFQLLLTPDTWKRSGNAPALVRLLQAYLQKIPNELSREGRLEQVLGIYDKLFALPSTENLALFVLNTVVENLTYNVIAPYVPQIWTTLFLKLQNRRMVKFLSSFVIFMSLFLVKHGTAALVDSMNAIQAGIFVSIVRNFWVPNLKLITGSLEVKLVSVASTRLIFESSELLDPAAAELWGNMLDSILVLLTQPEEGVDIENDAQDIQEAVSYSASFARLHNAGKNEDDPVKEVRDPKQFLVTSLATLSAASPGRYPAIIEKYVDPARRTALLQLCAAYNAVIV